jgi:Carboxypeptidase regulatory-like domain
VVRRGTFPTLMRSAVGIAAVMLFAPRIASAQQQTGAISGVVVVDTTGQGIAGATVTLLDASRMVLTNLKGEFRILSLPPRRYVIEVRHVGYAPVRDSLVLESGGALDLEIQLVRLPVQLDSVTVRATHRAPSYLDEFEDRRKTGFGHFMDSVELRRGEGRSFAGYIAGHFAGLSVTPKGAGGGFIYVSNGRSQCSGKAFSCGRPTTCYPALYVDGLPAYIPGASAGDPPDLADYHTEDFAAVEWYY